MYKPPCACAKTHFVPTVIISFKVKAGMYMELRKVFRLSDVFILTDAFKDCFNVFLPLTAKVQEDQIWAEFWEVV